MAFRLVARCVPSTPPMLGPRPPISTSELGKRVLWRDWVSDPFLQADAGQSMLAIMARLTYRRDFLDAAGGDASLTSLLGLDGSLLHEAGEGGQFAGTDCE